MEDTYGCYHFKFPVSASQRPFTSIVADDEWPPIHPVSIHCIVRFAAMLESYHKLQQKPKQFPSLKMHLSRFCLP